MPATAKICGVTAAGALDAAIAGGASHVGFVFFPASPRDIAPDRAAALTERAGMRVRTVGVFVDPEDAALVHAVRTARLDTIQLHRTTPDRVAHLRRLAGVEAWAAVAVRTRADLNAARGFRGAADRILYDAKTPEGSTLPGGMGVRFDWALLDGFAHTLPWALSGGLTPANVREAVDRTGARLVDASSSLESAPGVKDVARIAAFLSGVASA